MRARNLLPGLCVASLLLYGGSAFAQSAPDTEGSIPLSSIPLNSIPLGSVDCTDVTVEYEEEMFLTPEEELARMDQALNQSLNQFDACQISRNSNSGGGGGASGGSGGAGGAGGKGSSSGRGSTASSQMSGTQKQGKVQTTARQQQQQQQQGAPTAGGAADGSVEESRGEPSSGVEERNLKAVENGKVPEDIPPADNDSVLEAQIRKAAMNEQDPEVRARLWDEYRKYKGIESGG